MFGVDRRLSCRGSDRVKDVKESWVVKDDGSLDSAREPSMRRSSGDDAPFRRTFCRLFWNHIWELRISTGISGLGIFCNSREPLCHPVRRCQLYDVALRDQVLGCAGTRPLG